MLFGSDTELTKQLDAAGSEEGHKRGSSSTSDAVTSLDGEQSGRRLARTVVAETVRDSSVAGNSPPLGNSTAVLPRRCCPRGAGQFAFSTPRRDLPESGFSLSDFFFLRR